MRQELNARRQGEIVLLGLRLTLLGCAAALLGVIGMVTWRAIAG